MLPDQQTDCQFTRAIAGTPATPPADSSNAASSINVTAGMSYKKPSNPNTQLD
jgi:hypothetical protein